MPLQLWNLAGRRIAGKSIAGHGADFEAAVGRDGLAAFQLPQPFTFALYEYRVLAGGTPP